MKRFGKWKSRLFYSAGGFGYPRKLKGNWGKTVYLDAFIEKDIRQQFKATALKWTGPTADFNNIIFLVVASNGPVCSCSELELLFHLA